MDTGGASHIVFIVRERHASRHVGHRVPDLRHDLAGLQPLRRQQPLRPAIAGRARLQGELQPPVHNREARRRQDLLFNAEYPMVRWLEANGYDVSYISGVDTDRRRHDLTPSSTRSFMSVGPRRVLVGRPARERRGRARRGREPGVLQRQRDVLEDALGSEHRRLEHAVPHAGQLQGNARQREDRPDGSADLDRHLARPAVQPAGRRRPPGERAHRHDLHGQRGTGNGAITVPAADGKLRFWRNTRSRRCRPGSSATLAPARSATNGTKIWTTASARRA